MTSDGRRTSHGSILIIVAGLCSILLMLSMTFVFRMRSEAAESGIILQDAQARIMLVAAMQYVQESSRLGWAGASPAR
jgi:hypothetical protein